MSSSSASDLVLVDASEPAFTVFVRLPAERVDQVRALNAGRAGVELVELEELARDGGRRVAARIVRPDYPPDRVVAGLLELLQRFPESPFGLTWNGGIAVTFQDYQHARRTHERSAAEPAAPSSSPPDAQADPVDPRVHLGPLLGWE